MLQNKKILAIFSEGSLTGTLMFQRKDFEEMDDRLT
jgi:hypothetical protein